MLNPDNALKPTSNVYVGVTPPASYLPLPLVDGVPLTGRHLGMSGPVRWRINLQREASREMTPFDAPPDVIDGERLFEFDVALFEWTADNFDLLFQKASVLVVYEYNNRVGHIFLYRAAMMGEMGNTLSKREFAQLPLTFHGLGVEDRAAGDQVGQIRFFNGATRYL